MRNVTKGDESIVEKGDEDEEDGDETSATVVVHSATEEEEEEDEEEEDEEEDGEGDETAATMIPDSTPIHSTSASISNTRTPLSKPVPLPSEIQVEQVKTPVASSSSSSQARTPSNINSNYVPQTPLTNSQHPIPGSQVPSTVNGTIIPSDPPPPRLVLHKLVLHNFKSYAGSQTIGPFHKSFSSVVGPNGSGKSNVIDALLFVFGWRAKTMRQGKLGELIHNSEKGGLGIKECSVEVWFREIVDLVSFERRETEKVALGLD